jgi:carboxylate-amine ligase
LIASEIEIRSGRGETLATAMAAQRDFRRRLFALATDRDAALAATGTHPWADYREQRIIETEHYQRLNRELQYIVWRNNTFSLHVHVGVRGADRAVRTCDRLRPVLPLLLAISANSPYLDGQDSGLHSARTASFTRLFPRCGIPEPFGDWATFAGYVDFLQGTGSIVEYTQVWWSVRPHTSFGTVEVRICDAQSTAAESEALAALITGCVLQAAREEAEGLPYADIPGRLIEENLWRAMRWGLDGKLLDLEARVEYPASEAIERLAEWTAPARAEHGIELAPLTPNGAQRQRRLIEAGVPMDEVFVGATRETRETYSPEVVA